MNQIYVYPKGDFISGFSIENNYPCSYELCCQKMVITGMIFIDNNPEFIEKLKYCKSVYDVDIKPLVDEMAKGNDATGAMMSATLSHLIYAVKNGWSNYITALLKRSYE